MNTKQLLVFAALPSFLLAGHSAAKTQAKRDRHADEYSVVQIVLPPDPNCVAGLWHVTSGRRLNESGEVVGDDTCVIATGDETAPAVIGGSDAFRWNRASGATMLPALTAEPVETFGRDINESGTVIGWEFVSDGTSLAPVWPRAGGASLAIEGQNCDGFGALPLGNSINDRGDLLADDYRADATGLCRFVWVLKLASGEEFDGPANGAPRQLNNNGVAVGQSANRAMRWSPATGEVVLYEDPSAQSIGIALSINDRNEAVGRITQLNEQQSCIVSDSAAFWAASAQQTILDPLLGDTHAAALGINGISQVVGHSYRQPTCEEFDSVQSRAVIWQGTHAVDLNSLVPKRFAREFRLAIATAINDRGQIVARGVRRGEPKLPCPRFDYDPQTGENVYNASITCQNEYSFLLTPKQR